MKGLYEAQIVGLHIRVIAAQCKGETVNPK